MTRNYGNLTKHTALTWWKGCSKQRMYLKNGAIRANQETTPITRSIG